MPLKTADDKSKRVALLQDLQKSTWLDTRQKQWLREELGRLRKGIEGEREAAYFLDQHFQDAKNHVVLHDLRIVVDGDVAQIDHLIFNRAFGVYLLETKNYAGNVTINEHGEFTVDYGDAGRFGVESPMEQSRRHARVLQKLFERLEIKGRTGAPLECFHVVMFHPRAIINRPDAKVLDTSGVIKADQFPSWHRRFVDKDLGIGQTLVGMLNLRSLETITEWGEKLKRQHRPADLLALPEFMKPKEGVVMRAERRRAAPAPASTQKPAAPVSEPMAVPSAPNAAPASDASAPADKKRLICLHCQSKISYPEGKFCWNNAVRFGGGQYCREHQALFAAG